jgi:hypothetical protein
MSGDYSRFTDKPRKRFSGVRMQQGRVQLDADWNEEIDILKRRWEIQAVDTFGRAAVPKKTTPNGFKITSLSPLAVGAGRMYVDGLLAERLATDPQHNSNLALSPQPVPPAAGKQAVIYLDIWEREVTYIEDPDLLEPALGGPDTTTRTQVVWQVKVKEVASAACGFDLSQIVQPSAGRLTSQAIAPPASTDPCVLPPTGNYRGLENRLYRVEVHQGSAIGTATYKWSRENASIVSRVTAITNDTIKVTRIGRDKVLRFQRGDWVEILDDALELNGDPGFIARIAAPPDEATLSIKLDRAVPAAFNFDPTKPERHTRVRRWDHRKDETKTELPDGSKGVLTTNGAFVELEDGIEVKITAQGGGNLKTGDAWCFAARAVDGSVELLTNEPPRALQHHYAQLAYWDGKLHDCRPLWPDEQCCCCTVEVGDGVTSHGDYDDLAEAIHETYRRTSQWVPIRFCLLPGTHRPPAIVLERDLVTVSGCGRATVVEAPQNGPAFRITASAVRLENLYLTSPFDVLYPLIEVSSAFDTTIVGNLFDSAYRPLLAIDSTSELSVRENIFVGNGVRACGMDLLFARNHFVGSGDRQTEPGLLHLLSNTRKVRVSANRLHDGPGHGIVLSQATGSLSEIVIADNDIRGMKGSGITTAAFSTGPTPGISGDITPPAGTASVFVYGLRIEGNTITGCVRENAWMRDDGAPQGGIVIGGVEHLLIADNCIDQNGALATGVPVAGIYVGGVRGLIVRDNVVVGNGLPHPFTPPDRTEGGIVAFDLQLPVEAIGSSWTDASSTAVDRVVLPSFELSRHDGWPTAMVHGNVVVAPRSRALTLIGFGPMEVTDNRLVSRALVPVPGLGAAGDTGAIWIESGTYVETFLSAASQSPNRWSDTTAVQAEGSVIFSDNQVSLDSAQVRPPNMSFSCVVLILATHDLAFQDNVVRCWTGTPNLAHNTYLKASTVRASGNGIFEALLGGDFVSFPSLTVTVNMLGGMTTVTDNQVTHCIYAPPTGPVSVLANNLQQNCHGDVIQWDEKPFLAEIEANRQSMLARMALATRNEAAALRAQQPSGKVQAVDSLARHLEFGLRLAERTKEIQPNDWSLLGRVLDPEGKPVAGARLEISEGGKKLSEIPTDDQGEFFAHYSGQKFKDLFARAPQLKLTVKSADGKVLQTFDRPLVPQSDRLEALELRTGQPATAPPQAAKAPEPAPEKPKKASRKPTARKPKPGPKTGKK